MAAPRSILEEVACSRLEGLAILSKQSGKECAQKHVRCILSGFSARLLMRNMQQLALCRPLKLEHTSSVAT